MFAGHPQKREVPDLTVEKGQRGFKGVKRGQLAPGLQHASPLVAVRTARKNPGNKRVKARNTSLGDQP